MTRIDLSLTSSAGNNYEVKMNIKSTWIRFWESDQSCDDQQRGELYQTISDGLINRPYVDEGYHHLKLKYNNRDLTVYRPNHDTAHALRRVVNTRLLIKVVQLYGSEENRQAATDLTREEQEAIALAGLCFRAGRTNEKSGRNDPSNASRSADIFKAIARALEFTSTLVDDIAFCIATHAPQKIPYQGYNGQDENSKRAKLHLVKAVLDVSHDSDLVRCYSDIDSINTPNLENLSLLMPDADRRESVNKILLDFARASCFITGTWYFRHDDRIGWTTPPRSGKAKVVTDSAASARALANLADRFYPFMASMDVNAAKSCREEIETSAGNDPKIKIACAMQRNFRKHRAHTITEQATGIHPDHVSKNNLEQLKNELNKGQGLSEEKQAILKNEKNFLLPEEQPLYRHLLTEFAWTLKHVTSGFSAIEADGSVLKSLYQRNRESRANDVRFTNEREGRSDNIYWTIGSPNGWPADFLQTTHGHEIRVPLRPFLTKQQVPTDKLAGLWISSTWVAYLMEYTVKSEVEGVVRQISYRKGHPSDRFLTPQCSKQYRYTHPNGDTFKRTHDFGQETFTGAELLPFLALNTILELRLLGAAFRHVCLSDPASTTVAAFVDMLYELLGFEVLLPAKLYLDDPRIQVLLFNQASQDNEDNRQRMIQALTQRNIKQIDALIDAGVPIDINLGNQMTPLVYLLVKEELSSYEQTEIALHLIYKGANIQLCFQGMTILTHAVAMHCYAVVEALLSTGIIDKRAPRVRRYLNIHRDSVAISYALQDKLMFELLLRHGLDFSQLPTNGVLQLIATVLTVPELRGQIMLDDLIKRGIFSIPAAKNKQVLCKPLQRCLDDEKYSLLQALLGAVLESTVDHSPPSIERFSIKDTEPLLALAEKRGDEKAITLLKEHGACHTLSQPSHNKVNALSVFIENSQGELLVARRRQKDSTLSARWSSFICSDPFDTYTWDSSCIVQEIVFAATGIRCNCTQLQSLTAVELEDKIESIYRVKLDEATSTKASDTEEFAQPRWISAEQCSHMPLDRMTRRYLEQDTELDYARLIQNREALIKAIKDQNSDSVEDLLKAGVFDVNHTALQIACDLRSPSFSIIKKLLDNGYDINAVYSIGTTTDGVVLRYSPLLFAVMHNNTALAALLIDNGANVNQAVGDPKITPTPLMIAAKLNNIDFLAFLESKGADYWHANNRAILAFACFALCSDKTFYYLLAKADCDGQLLGNTPLLVCCEQQNADRVDALLKKGVDISVKHPVSRKKAAEIFQQHDGFEKYSKPAEKVLSYYDYAKDYTFYLTLSGALERNDIDGELLREYYLTVITQDQSETLQKFANELLRECGIDPDNTPIRLAIAHEGNLPVFSCAGFETPVIALHKDFITDAETTVEQLRFAIAHELEYLKEAGDRQFNVNGANKKIEYDQKAAALLTDASAAQQYLQRAERFYNTYYLKDHFSWPNEVFKGDPYAKLNQAVFPERIKSLKCFQASREAHHPTVVALKTPVRHDIVSAVRELAPVNYFPDFPIEGGECEKCSYLMEHLPGLKEEFLPFQLYYMPSQRLKQFCRLLTGLEEFTLDKIIDQANNLALPGFAYLYKSAANFPPMHQYYNSDCSEKELQCLGLFKAMQSTIKSFIESAQVGHQDDERLIESAQHILNLYPSIKVHTTKSSIQMRNTDFLLGYVDEHNGVPDALLFGSDVGNFIKWPVLNGNEAVFQYAKEDKKGVIWRALWILGVCEDPRLYPAMDQEFLKSVVYTKFVDMDKNTIAPIIVRSNDGENIYSNYVKLTITKYLASNMPVQTEMLKGHFMHECESFIQANRLHLILPNTDITAILLKHLSELIQGTEEERQFVINFFCKSSGFFDRLKSAPLSFNIETINLFYSPYLEFLLEHKKFLTPTHIHHIVNHMFAINKDKKIKFLIEALDFEKEYPDECSRLIARIDLLTTSLFRDVSAASSILCCYLNKRPRFDVADADTLQLLEYLNEKDLASEFIGRMDFRGDHWKSLSTRHCILLYRVLDGAFAFPNEDIQHALGEIILARITARTDCQERIALLEQLLFIKETPCTYALNDQSFSSQVIRLLSDAYTAHLGRDDGSQVYTVSAIHLLNRCYQSASRQNVLKLFDQLADGIEAQWQVSQHMSNLMEPEKNEDYMKMRMSSIYVHMTRVFSMLGEKEEDRRAMIDFIASPLSASSLECFTDFIINHPKNSNIFHKWGLTRREIHCSTVKSFLRKIHEEFWGYKIHERAVILDSLMITAQEEVDSENAARAYRRGFEYVAKKLFPRCEENSQEEFAFALLTAYLETADENERQFLLAGTLVTSNESDEKATLGRKFALLCEHMGPAYIKLAQAIHSHPDTPEDLKQDLAHVKGRANPPYRWQWWRVAKTVLPEDEFQKIKRFGTLLGSASYNLAIECEYEGNAHRVLILLRENAAHDAKKGFAHLEKTINTCQHPMIADSRQTFINMIKEAREMSECEMDNEVSQQQHRYAQALYRNTKISVVHHHDTFLVCLMPCDQVANGPGFKVLSKMHGDEFNQLASTTEAEVAIKKVIAKAVMEKELSLILKGEHFDCDRHGSQLRVSIDPDDQKTIHLGLYDFGEMSLNKLTQDELDSFAALLRESPGALKKGQSTIHDLFQEHIKKAVDENRSYRHLMRIHKGLLALSDFQQYLTNKEIIQILSTIRPHMHPLLREALKEGYRAYMGSRVFHQLTQSITSVKAMFFYCLQKPDTSDVDSDELSSILNSI